MSVTFGQNINLLERQPDDKINALKENSYYKGLQEKLNNNREERGIWVKSSSAKGLTEYYLDVAKLSSKTFFTTVRTHGKTAKVPMLIKMIMGQKVDLKDRVESLIDSYKRAVVDSKSHNLIMARIGGMKMSTMSFVLSLLGVPVEELKKLKKQALEEAMSENLALFEENVYNMELLSIIGGGGKKAKGQMGVLDEIQKQLLTQAKRLNINELYTKDKILEMRGKVCKDIYFKFKEEEANLQYELDYYTTNY